MRSLNGGALFFFLLVYLTTSAAWLKNVPETICQPDGTVIDCFATGDEFYNWLHDLDGYTIIQNQEDGFYYYAKLAQGKLVPSEFRPGKVDPKIVGLTPWTNISPQEMKKIRTDFFKNEMPEKPHLPGYNYLNSAKNAGTLNNLVVYIRFSDQTEFTQDTMFYFDMFNNERQG